METTVAVILAAGEGKRMKSDLPKVLHSVCGRTLLGHVLAAAGSVCTEKIVVVGHGAKQVMDYFGDTVQYAMQEQQLGTGHAVMQAGALLPSDGTVLVLCGDTPLLTEETMDALLHAHRSANAAATILTAIVPDPGGYGRIIRGQDGRVERIVEERDATPMQRDIREINTGTYVFDAKTLRVALNKLSNENSQGEYYLTDCIEFAIQQDTTVSTYTLKDSREALGVNNKIQLAEADMLMRERINNKLLAAGVTMQDPATTYIDVDVQVGRDTLLLPNTLLREGTIIGEASVIGPGCEITGSTIGSRVKIRHSVVTDSIIEDEVTVGPFAHLRPDTVLRKGVKVGDFVEIKKSDIGNHSKIPHLSYVGDAEVGTGVNIGAGTIIVNYDGCHKYKTTIEDRAFIGCNSNLVAPLTVGRRAFVAAGSTITKDVPPGSLSLARPKQVNKDGMAERFIGTDKDGDS